MYIPIAINEITNYIKQYFKANNPTWSNTRILYSLTINSLTQLIHLLV